MKHEIDLSRLKRRQVDIKNAVFDSSPSWKYILIDTETLREQEVTVAEWDAYSDHLRKRIVLTKTNSFGNAVVVTVRWNNSTGDRWVKEVQQEYAQKETGWILVGSVFCRVTPFNNILLWINKEVSASDLSRKAEAVLKHALIQHDYDVIDVQYATSMFGLDRHIVPGFTEACNKLYQLLFPSLV